MSYCRFSSDDYRCDVYVYETMHGVVIAVAANRPIEDGLRPQRPPGLDGWWETSSGVEAYCAHNKALSDWLDKAKREHITLPDAGKVIAGLSYAGAADRLETLRGLGYRVPQRAIDALRQEAAEEAANSN